ncbi:helix-turn-helix domain-containing protein [Qipengyuania atrilutea]|uniref:Helix-turn-helix transcriptional regulator n=1 Tax=Qipengyuania atrilutea TaxID=2744473 RepID=A0A850H3U5_9SPHN|nr:helix-turn-helix transcriptional regulator [Actirhodobacter atriluteus]NVD45316.1 helix-turn-helix transcriptional regulator [Actirhodobacter atriluteus]
MPIKITLDAVLAHRKMTAREVASRIGISETQMSLFRSGKVRGLRFSTLARMCAVLRCLPGDLLDYQPDTGDLSPHESFNET